MVTIRLARFGKRNDPFFKILAQDHRKAATKAFVEKIGFYKPSETKPQFVLDNERYQFWISKGAQATPRIKKLVKDFSAKK